MAYNIFERWPFTSFQNLNLDWVLKTVKTAADQAAEAAQTVTSYAARLLDIEVINRQQNSRLDNLETADETFTQDIRSLNGWNQEQDNNIQALSDYNDQQDARISDLEAADSDNVKITVQELDSTEKTIARDNIGAGTSTVTYDDNISVLTIENVLTGDLETVPIGEGEGNPNAVLYVQQSLTNSQKVQARSNIGAGKSTVSYDASTGVLTIIDGDSGSPVAYPIPSDAVRYGTQTLTDAQKTQARTNIGAGTSNITDAVQYVQQNLTHEQKIQARENIGAGSTSVLYNPNTNTLIIEENGVTSSYPLPTPIEQIIFGYRDIENNNPVVRKRSDNTVYSAQDMYNDYMNHKLIVVETSSQGLLLINSAEELTVGGVSTYIAVFYNLNYHMVVTGSTITELTNNALLPNATAADAGKIPMVGSSGSYQLVAPSASSGTPKITMASTDTTPALDANKFYVFPEMASLSVTLNTPANNAIVNEFHFRFTSGSTATQFDLPATVEIPDDFDVAADTVYEISIIDNYMVYSSWAVSA